MQVPKTSIKDYLVTFKRTKEIGSCGGNAYNFNSSCFDVGRMNDI